LAERWRAKLADRPPESLIPPAPRPRLRDELRPAHEVYGVEDSAYHGPPLPCYVPPRPRSTDERLADLEHRLRRLEGRDREGAEDLDALAAAVARLEGRRQ
jgi:hypothetical protein